MPTAPPTTKRAPWRLIASIVGGIATLLSLVLGVIAILPILTQNASGVDKLAVDVRPYRSDDVLLFMLPAASVGDFPVEEAASDSCSPRQLEWLDRNATALPGYWFVTITNKATSGNVIGFRDIAGDAKDAGAAAEGLVVECDQGTANRLAAIVVDTGSGRSAYYDRSRMADAGESPETPLVYNLQPGESGQFVLLILSRQSYNGEVRYTVTSGTDSQSFALPLGSEVDFPGTGAWPTRAILPSDPAWECLRDDPTPRCFR